MQLSWSNVNIPKQIIPTSALFSTTAAPAAPAQPGNLTATAISDSQVQVKWSDNSNNETGFLIERKTGAAGTWTQIGAVEFNLVSFVDQTVAVNTTYTYRVRATNAIGQSAYTDEVTLTTPAAGPVQSPFSGTSLPIPGLIEAENFDQGGQNIAWFDLDDINEGGQYRSTGVDIEVTSDSAGGGYQIGYTKAGEWLEYTINVATAGTYTLELRVAAGTGGGIMHVEFDGVDKTGAIEVVPTNWFDWKTISKTVNLSAGTQVMRLSFDTAHSAPYIANVNWMRLTPVV
jgi:hypothetical protein